ncbi:DUF6161 domain-containing protein [Pseudomonas sp. 910_21]|uniref:DUF6161 domain-containing protein n=1 Tax=Pseudomonas sp. 910_21 TaxID=2604460 RepID=UPI0040640063
MQEDQVITLRLNEEKIVFENRASLEEFFYSQEQNWKWLTKLPQVYREVGNSIFKIFFLDQIGFARSNFEDGVLSRLELGSEKMPFVTYDSDEGYLIGKVRKEYGDVTAALSLIYLNKSTRNAIVRDEKIKAFVLNSNLSFEKSIAIQVGLSFQNFIPLISDARSTAVRDILERFISQADMATEAVNSYVSEISEKMQASTVMVEDVARALTRSYLKRKKNYISYAGRVRLAAKNAVKEATDTLASAKAAYHDQVDLDASVQYWTARKKNHEKFKFVWFLAILVSMLVTFFSMLGYYGMGGAVGLSYYLKAFRPPEMLISLPSGITQPSLLVGRTTSELSLAAADLAGAILLITLLSVIVRICLRQFNNHSHLALESAERITFTKTYLALLNEGKLKSDEDRKLILESLFRSTQSGTVAEIPFSSPVELILKTLGEKKAT